MWKNEFVDLKERFKSSAQNLKSTRAIVLAAILTALQVVIAVFSISLIPGVLKISFGFIPVSILCFLLGPVVGGVAGGVCDILKYMVAPDGPFFIGYTISEILTGIIYGSFLYKKEVTIKRVVITKFVINLVMNIILTPLWLHITIGKAWAYYASIRIVKNLLAWPIESIIMFYMLNLADKVLKRNFIRKM